MNRMEEYQELMMELEQPVAGLEQTLDRAKKRRRRKNMIYRPFIAVAASFVLFVVMVNYSATVAYACSQIPFLKELAEAVTFSGSLTDAVENEYVQTMDLIQKDGDVIAKVEYLIVDQKQVNVFFKLDSDVYNQMKVEPDILDGDGSAPPSCSYVTNDYDVPNGELQSVTIDFSEENVPDKLKFKLDIQNAEGFDIAHFDFLLEFDPEFTAAGKVYEVNETVLLEGQKITITDVEVYPTHMRVNIEDDLENTAWLKRLDFYIVANGDRTFEPVSSGITATSSTGTPTMASFRAESAFFYDAKQLKLVITGAEWLKKDMEKVYINLETGKGENLPEGVELYSVEENASGWILQMRVPFREKNHYHQVMSHKYYDAEGNEYEINNWSKFADYDSGKETHFIEEIPLTGYHEKEVWLSPQYSHEWKAEDSVSVEIQ